MKKIAIYSRKSVFTGKGESVENQIALCKDYCEKFLRYDNADYIVYEDEGFSGKNINRPQFKLLLDDIKKHKIDILVCYRLDRISRSVADFASTLEILNKYNVDFLSIREKFDTTSANGRAMLNISATFAQLERETIAERVKDNMLQMAKNGYWTGGQLPLGYDSIRYSTIDGTGKERSYSKLKENIKELDVVRLIYSEFLKNNSILDITKLLNENNLKGKNRCDFDRTQVKRILRNPLYVKSSDLTNLYLSNNYSVYGIANGNGYLTYNKSKAKDKWIVSVANHKGIIEDTNWLLVQKILDNNATKVSNRTGTGTGDNTSLFSGILKCSECGENMVIKYNNKNKYGNPNLYYICSSKTRKFSSKCKTQNLNVKATDIKILEDIKSYNKEVLIKKYEEYINELIANNNTGLKEDLKEQIKHKEKQINNLVIKLSNIDTPEISDVILNQLATLTNEVKDLKIKLSNSDIQAANVEKAIGEFKNIKNLLLEFDSSIDSTEDIKVKRQLIRNVVKSVKYNEVDKTFFIEFYHP